MTWLSRKIKRILEEINNYLTSSGFDFPHVFNQATSILLLRKTFISTLKTNFKLEYLPQPRRSR